MGDYCTTKTAEQILIAGRGPPLPRATSVAPTPAALRPGQDQPAVRRVSRGVPLRPPVPEAALASKRRQPQELNFANRRRRSPRGPQQLAPASAPPRAPAVAAGAYEPAHPRPICLEIEDDGKHGQCTECGRLYCCD